MIRFHYTATLFLFCLLLLLGSFAVSMAAANNHNPSKSAYDILGVSSSKHATQEEIKRQYRACCLKYHPDKNVDDQKNCEQKFKQIQDAYDKIGKPEARRIYDMQQPQLQRSPFFQQQQRSSGNSGQSSYYGFSSFTFDGTPNQFFNEFELRRAFQNAFQNNGNNKFYFGTPSGRSRPQFPTFREPPTSLKSIFVQKVFVPLETLYNGVDEYEFHMPSSNVNKNNNIISNIIASFRGGLGYFLLYQSFLYSIPIIKLTKWGAFAAACMLFLHHLPQPPSARVFKARIRPGYKGGTRFIFTTPTSDDNHNNCVQMEFVIAEAKHDIYQREGNNLYTTIQISRKQAKYGCRIYLPSLDNHKDNNGNSNMIQIQIPPRTKMGDTIRIRGRGWYNRKQQHYGDLLVQVLIKRRSYFASSTT